MYLYLRQERLVVRQSTPQEIHSQVIAEYARRTSTPIGPYSSFIFAHLNCAVVDELNLYHDNPWIVELFRFSKLRRLKIISTLTSETLSRDAWSSILSCGQQMDSISIEARGSRQYPSLIVSKLIHGNDRLVHFRFRLRSLRWSYVSLDTWVHPPELRNSLRRNRRRRISRFIAECNLLPCAYCDLSMETSLLYLLIQANCNALCDE